MTSTSFSFSIQSDDHRPPAFLVSYCYLGKTSLSFFEFLVLLMQLHTLCFNCIVSVLKVFS